MNRKFLALALLLGSTTAFGVAQEKQQTSTPLTSQIPASQNSRTADTVGVPRAELIALQNDVKRMRVILHQMENNMGAATSAQDPLKHQFELEIEMWQILLNQMDRRMANASGK